MKGFTLGLLAAFFIWLAGWNGVTATLDLLQRTGEAGFVALGRAHPAWHREPDAAPRRRHGR